MQETSGWGFQTESGWCWANTWAGAGLCAQPHLPPHRQAEQEPSTETCLIKRCCFFPPAYQSRSQQGRLEQGLLIAGSSLFVFLQVVHLQLQSPRMFLMRGGCCYPGISWAGQKHTLHSVISPSRVFIPTKIYIYQIYVYQIYSYQYQYVSSPKIKQIPVPYPKKKNQNQNNNKTTKNKQTSQKQKKPNKIKDQKKKERDREREKFILVNFATWHSFLENLSLKLETYFNEFQRKKILVLFSWK